MAQLDRATVCGTVGRRFESSWARSFFTQPIKGAFFLKTLTPRGEVAERFKAHAWKACVGLPLPRVRIPPSPPLEKITASYY